MKAKRDRLFKRGRPLIREFRVFDGDKVHLDVGLVWLAYKANKFHDFPEGMTKEQFVIYLTDLSSRIELFVCDDINKEYKDIGPIAIVGVQTDGWKIEPHTAFMPWATTRNKLRGVVAFMQMVRYKKIGCCLVKSMAESKPLFDKVCEYGVLNYVGKVPNGDRRGDEYLYSVKGKLMRGK